jgi:hypothetical protein
MRVVGQTIIKAKARSTLSNPKAWHVWCTYTCHAIEKKISSTKLKKTMLTFLQCTLEFFPYLANKIPKGKMKIQASAIKIP